MKLKRRKYIVDTGFQWKFVLSFIVVSFVGNGVSAALFILFSRKKLEELQWSIHVATQSTGDIIQPLFFRFNLVNLIFVALLLLIIGIWMMRKMNGPLYRITKDLQRVNAGDLSSAIILRKKDEFKYVAASLNEMLGSMRERLSEFRDRYGNISRCILDLEIERAKGTSIKPMAREILQAAEELRYGGPNPG